MAHPYCSLAPMLLTRFLFPALFSKQLAAGLAISVALLGGCASPPPAPEQPSPEAVSDPEPPVLLRDFATETLYELLLAEFAGIREQVEPALEIYTIQAHETRDPGVIERAIHIASYLRRGDVILDLAELWVEVEPDNVEVRRLLAFHLARSGRVLDAFPHGELLLLTGDDDYLQSLAAFAQDSPTEEKERLLSLYEELESEHPQNSGLLLGKAMLLRQLDRLAESLASTEKLISLQKDNETGQLLHAQLLHAMGDEGKAVKALEKALRVLPESKRLRLQYARFLSDKDLGKSRQQIAILAKQYPDDVNILFSLGLANKEIGLSEEAKATFNHLININKRASDAHFQLGKIAEGNGQPEEAVYQYRQVKDGQNLLPAAMRVANILTEHNNLSAAREHLSSLRAIYPAIRENLFQMEAELLIRQNRLNEAYDLLTSALQADPESLNLLYTRSIISAEQKDLAATESDLRAILALDADNATALNALGYSMTNLSNRHDEALALIQRAQELEPDNPAITDSLGWVYFHLGDLDRALTYLRQAFEAFPDGEVAAHLGEVLWLQGDQSGAEAVWRKGLENSPENKVLLETIERLAPQRKQVLLDNINPQSNTTP
ncbi:MAG: tetratricopeptide repeat protein [Porticoccaceae bacterium]